jgi:hypothetical protein
VEGVLEQLDFVAVCEIAIDGSVHAATSSRCT